MQGMSEDEGDAEEAPEVVMDEAKNEAARKARESRQEKLRKMMEDDGRSTRVIIRSFLTSPR
jgi:DNA polymerase delta subunit 3